MLVLTLEKSLSFGDLNCFQQMLMAVGETVFLGGQIVAENGNWKRSGKLYESAAGSFWRVELAGQKDAEFFETLMAQLRYFCKEKDIKFEEVCDSPLRMPEVNYPTTIVVDE